MGEILKFPAIKKSKVEDSENQEGEIQDELQVLEFKKLMEHKGGKVVAKACLFEGAPNIVIGGEIVVKINSRKYMGRVTKILERDSNSNVIKIEYVVPFLNGDDKLKSGEASFTYDVEKYD
ncbi:hypothetical protein ISS03_05540 [Patescibacteria group bacterium]|nr:hypothetical protein [Patescibacteria group bacterium]